MKQGGSYSAEATESERTTAVFEKFHDRIHRYVMRVVRDSSEAEDLVQETFLRAHRRLDSLKNPSAMTAWLYRIATHVCYDHLKRASRRDAAIHARGMRDGDDAVAARDGADPPLRSSLERAEMSACVQSFIDQLTDTHRIVLLLHEVHGMTNSEIAGAMNCSLATVKIRLHRARKRLRAILTAACEFSSDERGVLVCDRRGSSEQQ